MNTRELLDCIRAMTEEEKNEFRGLLSLISFDPSRLPPNLPYSMQYFGPNYCVSGVPKEPPLFTH